ncbi:cilia- and flagella-associated protein 276 isoform X2 [Manis javanica]|uniref:cilia- and flagella-associated protein 276 isoform X2 n=1 Tax=Manis javanica TaxID=9974 RepID=UPI003C6DA650
MPPMEDPFQPPKLDNDGSYLGKLQVSKKVPYKNPTHLAQQQEPWNRLSSTPTITSMRQDVYFFDPQIPKDDLDFRLAALYNHHTETFKNKSEILIQQETTQDIHGVPSHWSHQWRLFPKKRRWLLLHLMLTLGPGLIHHSGTCCHPPPLNRFVKDEV